METNILEITLISAQGLKSPSANLRRLKTYAVTWIDPSLKLRTRIDSLGGDNPTWNDKFLFRVSDSFIAGDTSAVLIEIYAVGYIKDFLVGTVRFLLSSCLNRSGSAKSTPIGTPAFNAVQIRRPSGRFHGVLNVAAEVYVSSEYAILQKVSAVSFRDLMERKEKENEESRRQRRLSRCGSRLSRQSSGGDSCDFSDGGDSTAAALKEWNCVRQMAGKMKGGKSDGGGLLCGLILQRKIPFCPSDQNLDQWSDSCDERG